MLRSMAGASEVRTVFLDTLTLGASEIGPIKAPALPERFIGADGIIGIDEIAVEQGGELAADGRLAHAHQPHQHHRTREARRQRGHVGRCVIG
jgi:hypothetical protein